jgi:hypothetical protein
MRRDAAREGFNLCDGKVVLRFRLDNKVMRACRTAVLARMLALILLARLHSCEATGTRGRTGLASVHRSCGWVVEPLAMAGYSGRVYLF